MKLAAMDGGVESATFGHERVQIPQVIKENLTFVVQIPGTKICQDRKWRCVIVDKQAQKSRRNFGLVEE